MIFLDTCVWFELLGVRTPEKAHEIEQAQKASGLFAAIQNRHEEIVTCQEQLIELIKSIEKATMRSASANRKQQGLSGYGRLKEFRGSEDYNNTKVLCASVIEDIKHFAVMNNIGQHDIEYILSHLEQADINDILYYQYCIENEIDFYTFDGDLSCLGMNEYLHIM